MKRKTIKITESDNFVWKVLTEQEAEDVISNGAFSLYALHDDDSEGLISDESELQEHLEQGTEVGIEVGFIRTTTKSEVI
tara:strand:+ start:6327 stop:6566 length:240 start_codon:yes stop_codon:yes gene_type:complete